MQQRWFMVFIVASGLLAQTPAPLPQPAAIQAPAPEAPPAPKADELKAAEATVSDAKPFDQLRPSQRKLAYTLHRAALSAHELAYFRSHPRAIEARDILDALVKAKQDLPEKAQAILPALEAYLLKVRTNHGLYDAEGKKILLEGTWKDLQAAAKGAAKTGPKGLLPKLLKLKGLLLDAKVDAIAPSWAEPVAPAAKKGKKAKAVKGPKVPDGFRNQKAIAALWVKRAQSWIENTPQEVDVKGEKKVRRLPDPVQTKALNDLATWLGKEDLDLLRDPAFAWLDLRRLGGAPGAGLLLKAGEIAASKAPEGVAAELALLPTLEPVLGDSKFSKGEERRVVLTDVKLGPAPATLADQAAAFEKLGRSREIDVK